jgi:hypothetical protein
MKQGRVLWRKWQQASRGVNKWHQSIGELAKKLEPANSPEQDATRKKLLSGLARAVAEFGEMARQLYP